MPFKFLSSRLDIYFIFGFPCFTFSPLTFLNINQFDKQMYDSHNFMPWMYINILAHVDVQMKVSIDKLINNKLLKSAPKKSYHTYLIINDTLFKSKRSIHDTESLIPIEPKIADFLSFKNSILYVGKGTLNRKQQHLILAKKLFCGILPLKKVSLKLSKIATLWKQNKGVSLLQLDCDATTYEAFTRENCIIKSLNFNTLTNQRRGTSYGDAKTWAINKIINYGDMLLYQLFRTYLLKPPNVIYEKDIIINAKKSRQPKLCFCCKNIL